MNDTNQLHQRISAAFELHAKGSIAEAEQSYLGILSEYPSQADVCGLLGALYLETGRTSQAQELLQAAIGYGATSPGVYANLCNLLISTNQFAPLEATVAALKAHGGDEATIADIEIRSLLYQGEWLRCQERCEQQLRQDDNQPTVKRFLAECAVQLGNHDRAVDILESLYADSGDNVELGLQLAAMYSRLRRKESFTAMMDRFGPEYDNDYRVLLMRAGLGVITDDRELTEQMFKEVSRLVPEEPMLHELMAIHYTGQGRFIDAARALFMLNDLMPQGMWDACYLDLLVGLRAHKAAYRFAMSRMGTPYGKRQLAIVAAARGDAAESLSLWQAHLADYPLDQNARYNASFVAFLSDDYKTGWQYYEGRKTQATILTRFVSNRAIPDWDGEPIAGKHIRVVFEQGLGDIVQFMRYLPALSRVAGRIELQADESSQLVALLAAQTQGLTDAATSALLEADDAAVDYVAPLLSVPLMVGKELDPLAELVPYIAPPTVAPPGLRAKLDKSEGYIRVGLVWAGNPKHKNDHNRSIPFQYFDCLADIPGVRWFGLQLGSAVDEPAVAGSRLVLEPLTDVITSPMDTAWVLSQLDLVITVDSFVAHLAGAMGVQTWLLLPFVPDWRWGISAETTKWYPQMRLFRQPRIGDWADPVKKIAKALREMLAGADANLSMANRAMLACEEIGPYIQDISIYDAPVAWPMLHAEAVDATKVQEASGADVAASYQAYALAAKGEIPDPASFAPQHHAIERLIFDQVAANQPIEQQCIWLRQRLTHAPSLAIKQMLLMALMPDQAVEAAHLVNELIRLAWRHEPLRLACCKLGELSGSKFVRGFHAGKAVWNAPGSLEGWYELIFSLLQYGFHQLVSDLMIDYEPLLARHPNYGYLRVDLAQLKGDESEALHWADNGPFSDELMRGFVLAKVGKFEQAAACYAELLKTDPNSSNALLFLSMLNLNRYGRVEDWSGYEHRRNFDEHPLFQRLKRWRGEPLGEKRLLVFAEQGQGDQIYFAKCLQGLPREKVDVAVGGNVGKLIADLVYRLVDYDQFEAQELDFADYEYGAPIGDLAHLLGFSPLNAPAGRRYVKADAAKLAVWEESMCSFHGLKVGLAWAGNLDYLKDAFRSMRLKQLAPLASVTGVTYFGLQMDAPERELRFAPEGLRIMNLAPHFADFGDTAAAIASLDLVIVVDTSLAHLAGALGVPVWMMIPKDNDWRWGVTGEECPWYPSMRIFRQSVQGDWGPVVEHVRDALIAKSMERAQLSHE